MTLYDKYESNYVKNDYKTTTKFLQLFSSSTYQLTIMKFTTVISTAAAIAGVASAPVPQAEGEATLGLITGLLKGILGGGAIGGGFGYGGGYGGGWGSGWGNGWGSGWGSGWGGSYNTWYRKKITVIRNGSGALYYYAFPDGYSPCGCYADAAYAVSEDDANKLVDDASFAVETNTAVTAPDDAANAPQDAANAPQAS